jgi:hypothetical protein
MDWKLLGFSSLAVYGMMVIVGMIISLLSSQLQCSKISFTESLKQGGIFALFPVFIYVLAAAFTLVRTPFIDTLESFGIPKTVSPMLGVGYLIMISAWVSSVWNIHSTEKVVCTPDLKEMTDFKKKMLVELQQKEEEKEKNAQKSK